MTLLVAFLGLVEVTTGVAARMRVTDGTDAFRAVAEDHLDDAPALLLDDILVDVAVGAPALVAMSVLTVLIRRPAPWARVAAWAACALLALVLTCTVAANPHLFSGPLQDVSPEVQAAWDALLPDWYVPVHYVCEAGMLLASVAASVLLAQTSAHEFYQLAGRVGSDDPRLWDIKRLGRGPGPDA